MYAEICHVDLDRLQRDVSRLEKASNGVSRAGPEALKSFAVILRDILVAFLKDRREPVRPGRWFRDAAAKSLVPGDIAPRADALLVRWSGQVSPIDPDAVKEDASRFAAVAEKILPILKAYTRDRD